MTMKELLNSLFYLCERALNSGNRNPEAHAKQAMIKYISHLNTLGIVETKNLVKMSYELDNIIKCFDRV